MFPDASQMANYNSQSQSSYNQAAFGALNEEAQQAQLANAVSKLNVQKSNSLKEIVETVRV